MNPALNGKKIAVVGLGVSNLSAVRYLLRHDLSKITIFDTRQQPPRLSELPTGIEVRLGALSQKVLSSYDMIVLGPGISVFNEEIVTAAAHGVEVVGDIELFAREVKAPVIGITGSNGKSTVTALTTLMAQCAGKRAIAAANFGIPVFDVLNDETDLYVLELSSFELETTDSLRLKSATILNVSEDHLDRYHGSIDEYAKAKQRIFKNAQAAVINRADPRTVPYRELPHATFGTDGIGYGRIVENGGEVFLGVGGQKILNVRELKICGLHNELNALASMALCDLADVGIDREAQIKALRSFRGLPHRCHLVVEIDGVTYYNDSKATNVASAQAAIEGLSGRHKEGIFLLAGGLGKGQDFSPLKQYIGKEVKKIFCFGKDAQKLLDLDSERCVRVADMHEGLLQAKAQAHQGQAVLLSPACASFDQFKGFEDRGEKFVSMCDELGNS